MKRTDRRLLKITDELAALDEQQRLANEELIYHEHLHDDAVRDAAVSDSPIDREAARETADDVARVQRLIHRLTLRRSKLDAQRVKLLARFDD